MAKNKPTGDAKSAGFPQQIKTDTDFSGYGASKWVRDYNATKQAQEAPSFRAPSAKFPTGQPDTRETGFTPGQVDDWSYLDPPQNALGTPLDRQNQPLPVGAVSFKPDGTPYWGENLEGTYNKIKGAFDQLKQQEIEGTEAYNQRQQLIERTEEKSGITKWWKVDIMGGPAGAVLKTLGAGAVGIFDVAEELIERPAGTAVGTLRDLGEESFLPALPSPIKNASDKLPEGFFGKKAMKNVGNFMEFNMVRMAWDVNRAITASISKLVKGEPVGYFKMLKDNIVTSRMAWSIGVEDAQLKAEFLDRVREGEDPDLVALDMQSEGAELIGRVFFDALGFAGTLRKSAKAAQNIFNLSEDLLKPAKEAIEFIASKGDDAAGVLKATEHLGELDKIVDARNIRVAADVTKEAGSHGFFNLLGKAKRMKATQEAGIFGSWIAQNAKTADEAVIAFEQLARMASSNADERMKAIRHLTGMMDDPSALFSDEAAKFSLLIRNLLLDKDGILNGKRLASGFAKAQATGDALEVYKFLGGRMDRVIEKTFPTLKQAVEAGEEVPLVMRAVNFLDNSAAGKVKNAVSWFSGRAYIGTNPGVAVRGGLYDLLLSVVDTDIGIVTKKAGTWADISKAWLGGMDHPALHKGLGSLGTAELGKQLAKEAGFRTFGDFMQALKGGDAKLLDKLTLPMARVLEHLEKISGARILGKATDDIMKQMLRADGALNQVDELVKAGLPKASADNLLHNIIGNYGDAEKVKATLLKEIGAGRINLYSSGAWIPDSMKQLLDRYGLQNKFVAHLEESKSLKETLEWLALEKENLFAKTSELAKQHVQAVGQNLDIADATDEVLAVATEELYNLINSGAPREVLRVAQELADESGDIWAVNKRTSSAWGTASGDLLNQLELRFADDPEVLSILRGMSKDFKEVTLPFAIASEKGGRKGSLVNSIVKSIGKAKGKDLPDLYAEANAILGTDIVFSTNKKKAVSQIWDVWLRDQKPDVYGQGRVAVGDAFDDLLSKLVTEGIPEADIMQIVNNSAKVDRARVLNELGTQYSNAVMIGGELKPVGPYMAHLSSTDNIKDLNRTIAKYTSFNITARPGTKIYDTDILQDLDKIGIKAENIEDVKPEEMFEAIQMWRVEQGMTRQAVNLSDLFGDLGKVGLPDEIKLYDIELHELEKIAPLPQKYTSAIDEVQAVLNGEKPVAIFGGGLGGEAPTSFPSGVRVEKIDDMVFVIKEGADTDIIKQIDKALSIKNSEKRGIELGKLLGYSKKETTQWVARQKAIAEGVGKYKKLSDVPQSILDEVAGIGKIAEPESLIPAALQEMDNMSEARDIYEMKVPLEDMFNKLEELVTANFGKATVIDPASVDDVNLLKAIDDYFVDAGQKVNEARLVASKGAEAARDFALHDYDMRYGFDAALSYLFNFHFWPSRTASKWLKTRIIANPGLVSAYMDYREAMQAVHQDAPDWWKYSINSNEILGIDMENPVYFRLENLVQPIYFMAGADFTDEDKRVNWWSSLMDGVGKVAPGYWNPLIQYGIATALSMQGEENAAAHWAGRALPATGIIKAITSILGVKEGRGLDLDPAVHLFSGGMDPFEENRVATMLATYIKNGDYTEEEILEAALNHEGEAWDRAVADQSQQYGWGNLASNFLGINSRLRTPEDLEVERFWGDYTRMWAMSSEMTPEEITYNLEQLRVAYPFMEPLLLGRKGGVERSEAFVWNVLARIQPGKTDDLSTAIGLPYDLIGKFYEDKGDTAGWSDTDRDLLFSYMIDLGASLELPDSATRLEWADAGFDYRELLQDGELLFGEDIWDKLDMAYVKMDEGINGSVSFQRYIDANPDVERAMKWKEQQIMQNPLLQEYYITHKKLRDYYKGEMYQKLEDQFGSDIWDKWDEYYSYQNTGQKVEAKLFKARNPEMKAYSDQKKIYEKEISAKMVEFGESIPEPRGMQLQEDFEPETVIQEKVQEFFEQPEPRAYKISEWVEVIGQTETMLALQAYNGLILPEDIREQFTMAANRLGMGFEDLLIAIGTADR